MNRPGFLLLCRTALLWLLIAVPAFADLTSVRGASTPKQLSAGHNNILNISWRVGVSSGHTGGVSSLAPAGVFDPAAPLAGPLLIVGGSLSQGGSGPFTLTESITISGAQVKAWRDAGIGRVVLRRTFVGGRTVIGDISFALVDSGLAASRGTAAELDIQRLQIALDEQQSAAKVVSVDEALQPLLTVYYAGSGLLVGKWQVAEPGSTEGKPLYRTLSLVRQQLVRAQQTELRGPVLPTHRSGKYLLRFCVTPNDQSSVFPGGDSACPIPELTVQVAYQVLDREEAVPEVVIDSPQQQSVNGTTPFIWRPMPDTSLYKLDIFEIRADQSAFVTGILLPGGQTQTPLSDLMEHKLTPGGQYVWQVSAVNAQGKVLAKSKQVRFVYQP